MRHDALSPFIGMSSATGRRIVGIDHLRQSLQNIVSTRIGSRVERRDYGSGIPDLIDASMTPLLRTRVYGEIAQSVMAFEPRMSLSRIQFLPFGEGMAGRHTLQIEGMVLGQTVALTV